MEQIVQNLIGKKVDVCCGPTTAFRGDLVSLENGVATLKAENDATWYVAVDKIAAISEVNDSHSRPGFIA